jgi:hypothetical protein
MELFRGKGDSQGAVQIEHGQADEQGGAGQWWRDILGSPGDLGCQAPTPPNK